MSSSMKIATVREKTIPAITAIAVITNCITASHMRLFVLGFTFVGYVCQVALAQTEAQSGSQSDVIEIRVFSVGPIMNFVSAQKRRVMPDTCRGRAAKKKPSG